MVSVLSKTYVIKIVFHYLYDVSISHTFLFSFRFPTIYSFKGCPRGHPSAPRPALSSHPVKDQPSHLARCTFIVELEINPHTIVIAMCSSASDF